MASREHRDRLIAQARQRMLQDRGKYSDEQLKECEDLYQVANKNWRSDSAKASLKVMIERYPDLNRTGCGALYLAQYERDREARIRRLQEVIEKYSDCCFGNGAQVGALARFYLGIEHLEAGKRDEAKKLFDEIQEQYPGAITHRGELISHRVKQILAQTGSTRAPAGGGN
jgi:tetratricopeptide (TPR) repeat protein